MICHPNITTIDITCEAPFNHSLHKPSNSDTLQPAENSVSSKSVQQASDTINTRFITPTRSANLLSVDFNDGCRVGIYNGLWASDAFELQYKGNGWYMLDLRLSGSYQESINDNKRVLDAFSCSLCHLAEKEVSYHALVPPDEPLTLICIQFQPSFLAAILKLSVVELQRLLHPARYNNIDPFFSQCLMTNQLRKTANELLTSNPYDKYYRLFAKAKVLELISSYLHELDRQASSYSHSFGRPTDIQRLYRVKEYLEANYKEGPTIETLCQLVGLSRTRLTEGFKSFFGATVHEYIQALRMEKAKLLFQSNLYQVSAVAEKVGYSYQANFSRAFKKHTGISPKRYVIKQKNNIKTTQ